MPNSMTSVMLLVYRDACHVVTIVRLSGHFNNKAIDSCSNASFCNKNLYSINAITKTAKKNYIKLKMYRMIELGWWSFFVHFLQKHYKALRTDQPTDTREDRSWSALNLYILPARTRLPMSGFLCSSIGVPFIWMSILEIETDNRHRCVTGFMNQAPERGVKSASWALVCFFAKYWKN